MSDEGTSVDWLADVDLETAGDDGGRSVLRQWNVLAFVAGVFALAAGFYVEHVQGKPVPLVENMEPVDWLLALSLLEFGLFLVVPLARNPATTREYLGRLRNQRLGVSSLLLILAVFAVGLVGPVYFSEPTTLSLFEKYQPPVFFSTDRMWVVRCVGEVANGKCHGTWKYPLGTTLTGKPVLPFVVLGARTALEIALIPAGLLVPLGVAVGLVSAEVGGRVDDVLMRVAEVFQTLPAVIVYALFFSFTAEYRLLLLIFVFGFVNWGSLARSVRNEALVLQDRLFVQAARSAGASRWEVIRNHMLPNLSRSIITNVALQLPLLVLTEAAISFVEVAGFSGPVTFGDPTTVSWGQIIYVGIRYNGFDPGWWITVFPSAALFALVLSLNLFGRALSDVLDPRQQR